MASIELFQPIDGSTESIWPYLSTAVGLSAWQADEVLGSVDDGNFSMRWPALGARMDLSVESAERPLIVMRAGQNELRLAVGDGGVHLEHRGLPPEDDLEGLQGSWRVALTNLAHAFSAHPRMERHVTWLFRPVPLSHELAHYYFTEPTGLLGWLGSCPAKLTQGAAYSLSLGQHELRGRVALVEEGRDVVLTLSELDEALLALRTFPGPEGSRVAALCLSTWGDLPEGALVQELDTCLKRLAHAVSGRGMS